MKKKNPERELDRMLDGGTDPADDQTRALKQTADDLRGGLDPPIPPARRDRALFVSGVAARRASPWRTSAISALAAAAAVILALAILGQGVLPGQTLYPVRQALGLADSPLKILDRRISEAEALVDRADEALDAGRLERAESLGYEAIVRAGSAEPLLSDLGSDQRGERLDAINDVYEDSTDLLAEVEETRAEALRERLENDDKGSGSDDSSEHGSGSGDDGGSSDSSGSGSSSDDSGSGDSSGPGSGSDNSGSGSSGSGSGSGD